MNFGHVLFTASIALAPASWAAEAAPPATIVVVGIGTVKKAPDSASLSGSLRGEGRTSVDALRVLADVRQRVETGLESLAGASSVEVNASELEVEEARSSECDDDDGYEARMSEGKCAVRGYIASIDLVAHVRPAQSIGHATSLAAELGLRDVSVSGTALDKPDDLHNAATTAAMADAQQKAARIAAAGGVRLGSLLKVQDEQAASGDLERVIVTAQKGPPRKAPAGPAVPMDLKPADVSETVRLVVTYGIGD